MIFFYYILHILIKAIILQFSIFSIFTFCIYFYTLNNKITLFYIYSKLLFVIGIFYFLFYIIKFFQHIIKTNLSWLIFQSIKSLEIKTSMLFNSYFASNSIYHACSFYQLLLTYIQLLYKFLILLYNLQFL